ncbi:hypothetical protein H9623_04220 [Oerskovia sp. Sa1BUA8]|uniref:Ig-like domain (Group 3) n=1 Tax=Oerskovia douganii TaxID=2762210 RepID=A0A9D5UEL6_9CELL|nr:hypothetical protein [Oerskovia douganii]MBE7699512.1 hypothetical protein [Oerskovia douganii]
MERRSSRARGARRLVAALVAGLTAATVVSVAPATAAPPGANQSSTTTATTVAAEQVLTWTGDNSVTDYKTFPATATAGKATIVFENSVATGSTFGMSHTLTFDTSTPGYNHDVTLDILASPFDTNGGKHVAEVVLTPGTYRYFCAIPGHGEMWGELVVTEDGGGGDDTTAPAVSAEVTGERDGAGAYVGGATVTLAATDDGSGVAGVEYDLDGAGWRVYDAPFVVETVGEHSLGFRATDEAGNTSAPQTATFTVVEGGGEEDTVAPTVTAEVAGHQDDDGAYVDSATVTVAAQDDGSGVASIEVDVHGGHWMPYTAPVTITEPGEHTVSYRATDVAGNVSEVGASTFVVVAGDGEEDTTAPVVAATVSGDQDGVGAYVGSATVTLTATDEGSGVASIEYAVDGGAWTGYTTAVVLDEPGDRSLAYRATDEAGNVSEVASVTLTVVPADPGDTVAPVVTAGVYGARNSAGEYVGSAQVRLTATDDDSGVATIESQVDGGTWYRYATQVVVATPGSHTVAFRATDRAGNVSAPGTVSFVVESTVPADTVAPEVTATLSGSRDLRGAFLGKVTITLVATDAGSGVDRTELQVDGGAWQRYAAPVVVATDGNHTVTYRATDAAGNVSKARSVIFTVVVQGLDRCPGSDVRPTVVIDGNDSTVTNVDTGNGCTINDLVAEDDDYPNHRAFLQHVKQVTRDLVDDGVIRPVERRRIITAAELSDVGR